MINIDLRQYGLRKSGSYTLIDVVVEVDGIEVASEDITNLDGSVDEEIINQLKNIVDVLEAQNKAIK